MTKWYEQEKPRRDIVLLAYALIVVCVLIILWGGALIAIVATVPNKARGIYHVLQWIFAFANIVFPIYGILGAWKSWMAMLFVFGIYCVLQIAWNVIYIIGLAIIEPALNIALSTPFAAVNIILHLVALGLTVVAWVMLFNYNRNRNRD
eukprot:CAMPEP_0184350670 /NCGR_PEP_ID=MMETSP1089-20130417/40097_1 /TAXON_ID=38269 ORGANISM="Gloeochaete wittrockiana, Strain SAG46.84" /NCGR_SAMPLE_ID=MMETSP1089 /ASSEMBLY_ACC=CAM_ASM_000445 /LENGTH=148 /DNA_ID=CAMNT_0026683571 /DNA_START=37 /DNA_END=483 /DNA_ORIENTATION=+